MNLSKRLVSRGLWALALLSIGMLGLTSVVVTVWILIDRSTPSYDEEKVFEPLSADVKITIDASGVPFIQAKTRSDAMLALGYLHAKERLYSMEMQRRLAAGELSQVVGERALGKDKINRLYGFRKRAERDYHALSKESRIDLDAYAKGVNAYIDSMEAKPWELILFRSKVERWTPADSLLIGYGMYINLQNNMTWNEKCRFAIHESVPEDVYRFLCQNGSDFNATLDGNQLEKLAVPNRASFAYLSNSEDTGVEVAFDERGPIVSDGRIPGSNAWAVSGEKTESGAAILANDMHLSLTVPNVWYRAGWSYQQGDEQRRIVGATLPGLPLAVIGSNGHLSWGLTNSRVDTVDMIQVKIDPDNSDRYLTPDGSEAFTYQEESFALANGQKRTHRYRKTRWGLVEDEGLKDPMVLRWSAMEGKTGIDLDFSLLESAISVNEAIAIGPQVSMPTLNAVFADRDGSIGWTLVGPLMKRIDYEGDVPVRSWLGEGNWEFATATDYPSVIDPEIGYLWSANNRMVGGEDARWLYHGDAFSQARAHLIEAGLEQLDGQVSVEAMHSLQSSVDADYYRRWRDLLITVLEDRASDRIGTEMQEALRAWDVTADKDSTGFRLVKDFHEKVAQGVMTRILQPAFSEYQYFWYTSFRYDDALWAILSDRPDYLVGSEFASWDEELESYLEQQMAGYRNDYGNKVRIADLTWGEVNRLQMKHPLSAGIPGIGKWVNMPSQPVSGDTYVINVVGGNFGVSQRMVVQPGSEEKGIFQMPGGQSGHPMSDYYNKGHDAWLSASSTPLLDSRAAHTITLRASGDAAGISNN